jgi:hypothetical protein
MIRAPVPIPNLTFDLKWLISNSGRSSLPQVYAARLPNGMVHKRLEAS